MLSQRVHLGVLLLAVQSVAGAQTFVNFVASDTTTKGSWKGVYGQDGNVIAKNSVAVPSYATFDPKNVNLYVLNPWSTDPRALLKALYSYSPSERIASQFHGSTYMDFEVNARDGQQHRIALYFCDWDNAGRSITVQALDAATGAIFDSRALTGYSSGIYLLYDYRGRVVFRVNNNTPSPSAPTASVSGFFWGGSSTPTPDTTPPSVSITSPLSGSTISGTVTLSATGADNMGITSLQFQLDGVNTGSALTAAPYNLNWNSTGIANGPHSITAVARDAAGNSTTSSPISIQVQNAAPDTVPPAVSISSPAAGTTVSGLVTISAAASDNVSVTGVQFKIDGNNAGPAITAAPYTISWNTATVGNGSHMLTAEARDAAGNVTVSAAVSVVVSNAASPSGNGASFLGTDTATLGNWKGVYGQDGNVIAQHSVAVPSYSTFEPRNVNLFVYNSFSTEARALDKAMYTYSSTERIATHYYSRFYLDFAIGTRDGQPHRIALYFCDWNYLGRNVTVQVLDGASEAVLDTRILSSYTGGVYLVYQYRGSVIFRVKNNNSSAVDSPNATLSALFWGGSGGPGAADTIPPTVSLTAPGNGATVSGTISLAATAADNIGVAGVQFRVDGAAIGGELATAPYLINWNTASVGNGPHTLTAVARDAAGNTASSSAVNVIVQNGAPDTSPPVVTITSPANNSTATGTVTLSATASDNTGVASVQFKLDGVDLGAPLTQAPYSMSWNSIGVANGSHTLTAVARDAAGNSAVSAAMTVMVNNPPPPSGSAVSFVAADTTTKGNWKGVYGQDGNAIANNSVAAPSYVRFEPHNVNLYTQDAWSSDPRALSKALFAYSPTERIASHYHTSSSMEFDVGVSDGRSHRIALYFCDWTRSGRSITVEALDAATGAVLDSRSLTNYSEGIYLVYNYQGRILFRIRNNTLSATAPTASLSAFFWGQ